MWYDVHLIAGVASGSLTAVLLHPLDTLKVKMQVSDGLVHGAARSASLREAARGIYSAEGVRGFYRGVSPALVGAAASWGLYFFFYEAAKRRLRGGAPDAAKLSPLAHAYAAWEGGTAVVFLTNPVWLVKTRMQVEGARGLPGPGGAAPYASLRGALRGILAQDGVRGLYRGLVPALCLTSHGVVQFTIYEALKDAAAAAAAAAEAEAGGGGGAPSPAAPPGPTSDAHLFAAGVASKAAAAALTYPYQVAKARLQQRFVGAPAYRGLLDCARTIRAREGLRGFYKGFAANLLRVAPQSALTLVVYERVAHALK
jgi:solute carrier family 25 folate transporter 32